MAGRGKGIFDAPCVPYSAVQASLTFAIFTAHFTASADPGPPRATGGHRRLLRPPPRSLFCPGRKRLPSCAGRIGPTPCCSARAPPFPRHPPPWPHPFPSPPLPRLLTDGAAGRCRSRCRCRCRLPLPPPPPPWPSPPTRRPTRSSPTGTAASAMRRRTTGCRWVGGWVGFCIGGGVGRGVGVSQAPILAGDPRPPRVRPLSSCCPPPSYSTPPSPLPC